MRKTVVLLVCGLLLLAGCVGKAPQPVTVNFTCDFLAEYDQMTFAGGLTRDMAGTLKVSLTSPESLSGMQFTQTGEKINVTLGNLNYTVDTQLPQTAVPHLISKALDDIFYAAQAKTLVTENERFTGRVGEYAYHVETDPDTGMLLLMEFPAAALSVRFSNVQETA